MRTVLVLCFIILNTFCSNAQEIDSTLLIEIKKDSVEIVTVDTASHRFERHNNTGNRKEALVYSKSIFNWTKNNLGEDHPDYKRWAVHTAYSYYYLGAYDKTLTFLEIAHQYNIRNLKIDNPKIAEMLNDIGFINMELGNYNTALIYLNEAVKREQKYNNEKSLYLDAFFNNIALVYQNLRDYHKALEYLEKARVITIKNWGKDHEKYAIRLENIANSLQKTNQHEKTSQYYKEALKVYENTVGKNHFRYINTLRSFSSFLSMRGQHETALPLALEVVELAGNILGKEHPKYLEFLISLSQIQIEIGQTNKAVENLNIIENNIHSHTKAIWIDEFHLLSFQLYKSINDKNKAKEYIDKISKTYLKIARNNIFDLDEKKKQAFLNQLENQNKIDLIFTFLSEEKNNSDLISIAHEINLLIKEFSLERRNKVAELIRTSEDTSLKKLYLEWQDLQKNIAAQLNIPTENRNQTLISLQNEADQKEQLLNLKTSSFSKEFSTINTNDLKEQISNHEIIIEFCHFNYNNSLIALDSVIYGALILKADSPHPLFIDLFSGKQIGSLKKTRTLYDTKDEISLNRLIWKKLKPHLKDIKIIHYSPSGLLHRINIGAIPINEIETISNRYILNNIGSTRQLVFPHQLPEYTTTDAIIYGGIDYLTDTSDFVHNKLIETEENLVSRSLGKNYRNLRGEDWDYLEWTNKEAEDIAKILKENKASINLLNGKKATETSFKKIGTNTPSPRILHLATHGYFFPDPKKDAKTGFRASEHPLIRSGLILAGANHAWRGGNVPAGQEDGILTAYEIAQMDLSNTELVVLSACNTGLGDIEGNEGVYGLQRAFKMAGAKYILMSLWSVDDKKTYEFMTRFYELYQTEGKSIPEAYQMTQNEMRKKYALPFNPRNWAGFVLVQ